MIAGQVRPAREAVVRLWVLDGGNQPFEVEAAIDTGFTQFLTLPSALVTALRLPFEYATPVTLGDGSIIQLSVYKAVVWDGRNRTIQVHEAEGGALVGMSLLYGYRLTMNVVDGGDVTIDALP
jgi:clan AA aspartic protease